MGTFWPWICQDHFEVIKYTSPSQMHHYAWCDMYTLNLYWRVWYSHVARQWACVCMYGIETIPYKLFCAQRPHVGDTSWITRTLGPLLHVPIIVVACLDHLDSDLICTATLDNQWYCERDTSSLGAAFPTIPFYPWLRKSMIIKPICIKVMYCCSLLPYR